MKKIQVLILAGGAGKRMWPITTPKNLLPFFGKPLIEQQIESFKTAGLTDLLVVVGSPLEKSIKINAKTVLQPQPLGQADAILCARKFLTNAPLLVINVNDFFQPELFLQIKEKTANGLDACLVGLKTDHYLPMGYLMVEKGLVKKVIEKPEQGKEPSNLVRLVVDYYREPRLLFDYLKKNQSGADGYERAISQMMADGLQFGLVEYEDNWATIKYPWDILKISEFFLKKRKKVSVQKERGVKIFSGAVVKNSYLGRNVIVGNNALVRDSIIEEGSVIGYNTEVARSYIGPNCWFHANYIGDSVLEAEVSFGSGARTANLRLDEKEVISGRLKLGTIAGRASRVGINTSLMPGVMIGEGSFVGPGLVLSENLKENQFCHLEQKLTVKSNLQRLDPKTRAEFRKKL